MPETLIRRDDADVRTEAAELPTIRVNLPPVEGGADIATNSIPPLNKVVRGGVTVSFSRMVLPEPIVIPRGQPYTFTAEQIERLKKLPQPPKDEY
jgi:hypothetical protein